MVAIAPLPSGLPMGRNRREDFGNVLRFFRKEKRLSVDEVGRRIGCKGSLVVHFEAGDEIPTGDEWARYKNCVDWRLAAFQSLRGMAVTEERFEKAQAHDKKQQEVPVALAEGTQDPDGPDGGHEEDPDDQVQDPDEPAEGYAAETTNTQEEEMTQLGSGKTQADLAHRRKWIGEWFAKELATNPDVSVQSAVDACKAHFGIWMDYRNVREIRKAISGQNLKPGRKRGRAMSTAPKIAKAPKLKPLVAQESHDEETLVTAAKLVLEAIPGLKTFKIDVGDDGEPRISFTRSVVTSGEITLKK